MRLEFLLEPERLPYAGRRRRTSQITREPSLLGSLLLAYQIDLLLSQRKAKNLKQIATWSNIGRTRLFQLLNLLLLAPSIQEDIVYAKSKLNAQIPEYKTRRITKEPNWRLQEKLWEGLISKASLNQNR